MNLFDLVEKYLMRPKRLREAIQAVVHENDELLRRLAEYKEEEPTNLTWEEGGKWYGYTYNEMHKVYLFDDTGHDDMITLWENLWARDVEMGLGYK